MDRMTGYQPDPDLITLPRAAARLGISATTAYRLAQSGQFPGGAALKVGRHWRVSVPRLGRYLEGSPASSELKLPRAAAREIAEALATIRSGLARIEAVLVAWDERPN